MYSNSRNEGSLEIQSKWTKSKSLQANKKALKIAEDLKKLFLEVENDIDNCFFSVQMFWREMFFIDFLRLALMAEISFVEPIFTTLEAVKDRNKLKENNCH